MCLPVALAIPVALAAAGTAVSVIGQIQSANNQAAALKAQAAAKNKEIDQQTSAQIDERLREARREQGRIMVAAGESGLNTGSPVVQGLLTDASMQATLSNQESLANRESRRRATIAEANAMMPSKPTLLGAGLQIAMSAAGAAQKAGAFKGGSTTG
jgi:hypothetical protein